MTNNQEDPPPTTTTTKNNNRTEGAVMMAETGVGAGDSKSTSHAEGDTVVTTTSQQAAPLTPPPTTTTPTRVLFDPCLAEAMSVVIDLLKTPKKLSTSQFEAALGIVMLACSDHDLHTAYLVRLSHTSRYSSPETLRSEIRNWAIKAQRDVAPLAVISLLLGKALSLQPARKGVLRQQLRKGSRQVKLDEHLDMVTSALTHALRDDDDGAGGGNSSS
ncbi:unnamed protein product, partial [Laminaria digitata]